MRTKLTVLAMALLGSLAIGVAGASAAGNDGGGPGSRGAAFGPSVKTPPAKATANIQGGNGYCGENLEELPVLGTVKFQRKGNVLKVAARLKTGVANTTYGIDIAGPGCEYLGRLGEFTTNKKGAGHGKGEITVPEGDTEFFADVDYEGFHGFGGQGDTPYVSLP